MAAMLHKIWARWAMHVIRSSKMNADGSMTIPSSLVSRWERQAATDYHDLSDHEKHSDRVIADEIMGACDSVVRVVVAVLFGVVCGGFTLWVSMDAGLPVPIVISSLVGICACLASLVLR
jgi:hypothetical protein